VHYKSLDYYLLLKTRYPVAIWFSFSIGLYLCIDKTFHICLDTVPPSLSRFV